MADHGPIALGKGRLLARAIDGVGDRANVWVAVEGPDGAAVRGKYTHGDEACFDLTPGDYHVTFRFPQYDTHLVSIVAGSTTTLPSTPRGRIVAVATDGLGQPANVWVQIAVGDEDVRGAFTHRAEAIFDLLPGDYTATFRFAQYDTHDVRVQVGLVTPIRSLPRGRLVAAATDGLGQPANVWVQIAVGDEDVRGAFTHRTEAIFDLLPGEYSTTFRQPRSAAPGFAQYDTHRIHINAGSSTVIGSAPRGRLAVEVRDGLGQPVELDATIFQEERPVTTLPVRGGHASVDLLSGIYRVTLPFPQKDVLDATVIAGQTVDLRSRARGRLAVHVLSADGVQGVECGVDVIDRDGVIVAHGRTDDLGRREFDLLPGRYVARAAILERAEAADEVRSTTVTSLFVRSLPLGGTETSASGSARLSLEGEGLELVQQLIHEGGASVVGHVLTRLPGGHFLSLVEGDSASTNASHDFYLAGAVEAEVIHPGITPPTVDMARAYAKALLRQGVVADADALPPTLRSLATTAEPGVGAPLPELDGAPLILHAGSTCPCPGQSFTLVGDFGPGPLRVVFAPFEDAPPNQQHEAHIVGRDGRRVTVVIPNIVGRCEVWCILAAVRGPSVRTQIYDKVDEIPEFERRREQLILGALSAVQGTAAPAMRLAYLFTRKQGHVTIPIASRMSEIEAGGQRVAHRWVVFTDVELRNGLRDATFRLRAALYPGTPRVDDAAPPNSAELVDVVTVTVRKVDGQTIYDARIWESELGPLVGATWSQDTQTLSVKHLFGYSFERHGLQLDLDTKEKRARLSLDIDDTTRLMLTGDEDSVLLELAASETRMIAGQEVRIERSHEFRDDRLATVLRLRAAQTAGRPAIDGTLRFDDPEPGAPVSYFSLGTRLTLDSTSLAVDVDYKENRLETASVSFGYLDPKNRIGLTLGYQRAPGVEGDGRHRWTIGATGKTELFDGKVEIEGGIYASTDVTGRELRALEVGGNVELGIEGLHFRLGGSAMYRTWQSNGDQSHRWSFGAHGRLDIANIDARLGVIVEHEADRDDARLDLSIDLGGLIGTAVEMFGGDEEHRVELWSPVDVNP